MSEVCPIINWILAKVILNNVNIFSTYKILLLLYLCHGKEPPSHIVDILTIVVVIIVFHEGNIPTPLNFPYTLFWKFHIPSFNATMTIK
jgi:hypothetical protein